MTTAADITAANTAVGLVVDIPTAKTALLAVMAVIADLNTSEAADAAAIATHTTAIAANTAALAANPYISQPQGTGILPTPVTNAPTAGAVSQDLASYIPVPGRVVSAKTADFALLNFTTPLTLTPGTHGVAYSKTLVAAGSDGGTQSFAVPAGYSLPAGLTLNAATGVLSGTIALAGTYTIVVTVTDVSSGDAVSAAFVLVMA